MEQRSEVARLREQIALEYEACQRIFRDPAITAPHKFIEKRQESIALYVEQLIEQVGPGEAARVFIAISEQVSEQKTS